LETCWRYKHRLGFARRCAVDRAIEGLAAAFPRPARAVEMRFFGGLELEEIGAVLGVTERTVKRDCAFARAWLSRELA